MKILYDTSVLVAVAVSDHPKHEICNQFYNGGKLGQHEILVCSHTIAELFSSLTRLPVKPSISPGSARQLIKENFVKGTHIVELKETDYERAIDIALDRNLIGGTIHDLLIYVAGKKENASKIATLNVNHFTRICSDEIGFLQTF